MVRFVVGIEELLAGLAVVWIGGAFVFGMAMGVMQVLVQWLQEERRRKEQSLKGEYDARVQSGD